MSWPLSLHCFFWASNRQLYISRLWLFGPSHPREMSPSSTFCLVRPASGDLLSCPYYKDPVFISPGNTCCFSDHILCVVSILGNKGHSKDNEGTVDWLVCVFKCKSLFCHGPSLVMRRVCLKPSMKITPAKFQILPTFPALRIAAEN